MTINPDHTGTLIEVRTGLCRIAALATSDVKSREIAREILARLTALIDEVERRPLLMPAITMVHNSDAIMENLKIVEIVNAAKLLHAAVQEEK